MNAWVEMGAMTGRNQDAIKKTAAGLLKLLYPHRTIEECARKRLHPSLNWPSKCENGRRINWRRCCRRSFRASTTPTESGGFLDLQI